MEILQPTSPVERLIRAVDLAREDIGKGMEEKVATAQLAKMVDVITRETDRQLLAALRGIDAFVRRHSLVFKIDPARKRPGWERVTHYFQGTNPQGQDRLYTVQDGMEVGLFLDGCMALKVKEYSPDWGNMPGRLLGMARFKFDGQTVASLGSNMGLIRVISQRNVGGWPIFGVEYGRRLDEEEIEEEIEPKGFGFHDEWGVVGHTVGYDWTGWFGRNTRWGGWNFSDLATIIREFPDGNPFRLAESGEPVLGPSLNIHLYNRLDGIEDPIARGQEYADALRKATYLGFLGTEIDYVDHQPITPQDLLH